MKLVMYFHLTRTINKCLCPLPTCNRKGEYRVTSYTLIAFSRCQSRVPILLAPPLSGIEAVTGVYFCLHEVLLAVT